MHRLNALLLCLSATFVHAGAVEDALSHPDRSAADRDRDERSKPAQVLSFAGVAAGMTAWDIFAAGGYYSEILARVVGPQGKVLLHNNETYLGFVGNAIDERLANERLPNALALISDVETTGLETDSVDFAIMVMVYHDLYWKREGWDRDPKQFLASLHRVIKPGGTLLIIDHAATAGSGTSSTQESHRIDPEFAKTDLASAGFVFEAALDVLSNPDDDRSVNVFDPAVRGKTDRFVYRFRNQ